ncbi:hypothetical protein J5N97_025063 [Dioscorea zingiberensis]|uniref:ribulose-phosphate 3-epimerase n=1 Tax=Dioscorea zingiberensis TaxID=325984 RepID=A0A9D5H971_9LILI|nr:hypothetical protein J5N97_025063 [Dioscorea zingiberensis]
MIVILVLISGSIYAILCFCGLNLYLKISTCGRALVDFAVLTLSKYGNQIHCLDYVEALAKAGASGFTFHIEVSKDNWRELIQSIKTKGMRPGVSLKPGTPIEEVYALVEDENPVEMVLIMTVEPGFGGQKFMPEMMDKVRALRKKYPSLDIEVDGGLGPSTIEMAASAGANCIVAGSSIFELQSRLKL